MSNESDSVSPPDVPTEGVGTEKPKRKLRFPSLKKSELSKLAKDIATNKVFCSCWMPEHDQKNLLGMVFMPLAFGALKDYPRDMVDDIGFVYEYYDKAGPRSINGYPIFFSCAFVSKADAKRIGEKVNKIRKILDEV